MSLKPCPNPWCWSEAGPFLAKGQVTREAPVERRVECGCGVAGPTADTEAEAITAWNTRPAEQGMAELVEALREARDGLRGNQSLSERTTILARLDALLGDE